MARHSYKYDAFISHAVEDKIGIATELCHKLKERGLKIWYSSDNIPYATSLSQEIHDGMNDSRFGVIIFSPTYLERAWPMQEFYHLWARDGKTKPPVVVLPVYYKTNAEKVSEKVLILGDRFSISYDKGIDVVADKITEYITKETIRVRKIRRMNVGIAVLALSILFLLGFYWWKVQTRRLPGEDQIASLLSNRIDEINSLATLNSPTTLALTGGIPSSIFVDSVYKAFSKAKSYYRNEYEFSNGFKRITARKNVNSALGISAQELTPANKYGMDSAIVSHVQPSNLEIKYYYVNRAPVERTVEVLSNDEKYFTILVRYGNNIRMVEVSLQFPQSARDTKKHKMVLTGFKPVETYEIFRSGNSWKLREIETHASEIIR